MAWGCSLAQELLHAMGAARKKERGRERMNEQMKEKEREKKKKKERKVRNSRERAGRKITHNPTS